MHGREQIRLVIFSRRAKPTPTDWMVKAGIILAILAASLWGH